MAIRAILIDLDGVVRLWDPTHDAGMSDGTGLPIETVKRIAFAGDLLPLAVTGRISDAEWRDQVISRLAAIHPTIDGRAAVAAWSRPIGRLNEPVGALVEEWRRQIPVVLLTNATSRLATDLDALGLTGSFDLVVNSSAIGFAKPDPSIFRYALEQVGVLPEEALFVDDTAGHVAAARDLGIEGFHFDGDVELLRAFVDDRLPGR